MNHTRLSLLVLALILALAGGARGQAIEKKQLTLGVGGKSALYYLPLTICERLGYFKEQGLDVIIEDFRGGAQSLQALVGGSVDVVTGAYEHTIRMQAKGQDIRAVILNPYFRHVSDVEGGTCAVGCFLHWRRRSRLRGRRHEKRRDRRAFQRRSHDHQA